MRRPVAYAVVVLILLAAGCTTIPAPESLGSLPGPDGAPFDHALLDDVLAEYVDAAGRVDYAALASDRAKLDNYHAHLAAISPDSHPALFPDEAARLAYWINAYNASVIVTVLHHYPIDSVKDVRPGALFFLPRLAGFFYLQRVELGGRRIHLYDLENGVIRERFDDPRLHFALNCASLGCPRLPRHAFHGDRLDAELEAETHRFVAEARNVSIDPAAGRIALSAIFDWYEEDFTGWLEARRPDRPATLIGYLEPYLSPAQAGALARCAHCALDFAPYDWRLNDRATASTHAD